MLFCKSVRHNSMVDSIAMSDRPAEDPTPADVAAAMYARDHAAQALGITLQSIASGRATMSMRVRPDMIQGHGSCHGGLIFSLADTAFAYACNTYNNVTVAGACSIEFLRPAFLDDALTAVATETATVGRNGVYDIRVHNQRGEIIATFRGKSVALKDKVIGASVVKSFPPT